MLAASIRPFPIVQIARSVFDDQEYALRAAERFPVVHSVLSTGLPPFRESLAHDPGFAHRLERSVGIDPNDEELLAGLLLAEAINANPTGITIFSSSSPSRIARAARVAHEQPFSAEQIAGLRQVAATLRV